MKKTKKYKILLDQIYFSPKPNFIYVYIYIELSNNKTANPLPLYLLLSSYFSFPYIIPNLSSLSSHPNQSKSDKWVSNCDDNILKYYFLSNIIPLI